MPVAKQMKFNCNLDGITSTWPGTKLMLALFGTIVASAARTREKRRREREIEEISASEMANDP